MPHPYASGSSLAEGVTVDAEGNMYGADFLNDVMKFCAEEEISRCTYPMLMLSRYSGGSPMRIGLFVIAALLAATSAWAHHSNSAFDPNRVVVLKGTVTQWKWT